MVMMDPVEFERCPHCDQGSEVGVTVYSLVSRLSMRVFQYNLLLI